MQSFIATDRSFTVNKLYINGEIITMDERQPYADAVYIVDGRIMQVGSDEEILSIPHEKENCIDLQGKTMLPSFIDAHSHFIGVANALTQCDLHDAKSFEDIVIRMKDFIRKNNIPPKQWVFGNGYDHNFLTEKTHPDKLLLDHISNTHPIVIIHASSHMGVANTKALAERKLDAATKNPQGGRYARYEGSNELTGYMEEAAFINFQNGVPMMKLASFMKYVKKAQEIYASYGITTVQEGMIAEPLLAILKQAASQQLLYLDVIGYIDQIHCRTLLKENKDYVGKTLHHFKIGGYKIFLDGSPQGRTAWMSTPYLGEEKEYYGYPAMQDEQVYALLQEALADDVQLLAHCNGDAAAEQYISQLEKLQEENSNTHIPRPVMIHAQLVRKDQLKRMRPIEMIPSFFIAHTYYWGDVHIKNFGKKRASEISLAKDAAELGLCYTFHQDSPIIPPDMIQTLWCAVNRKTKQGVTLGENQCLSPYEALKAITLHAAYQYFEEDRKGSITKGKLADLVILDKNPLTYDPAKLYEIKVLETIKEGKTIYKRT